MRHPCKYCRKPATHGDVINGCLMWLCTPCLALVLGFDPGAAQADAPDLDFTVQPAADSLFFGGCD